MPKTVKGGPLRFFNNHSVAKFQKNEGEPIGDFEKFSKKNLKKRIFNSLTKPKKEESHSAEKVRTFCFGILVKKLAHTHGFEHESSGLNSKHLTTRPRTHELCDLRAEMRELSRGKKHLHFPIALAYRKCN